MINLPLPDELVQELESIAHHENRPIADVVATMLKQYHRSLEDQPNEIPHPVDAFIGIFDDDITDMSTTVRETLEEYYQEKYGRPD